MLELFQLEELAAEHGVERELDALDLLADFLVLFGNAAEAVGGRFHLGEEVVAEVVVLGLDAREAPLQEEAFRAGVTRPRRRWGGRHRASVSVRLESLVLDWGGRKGVYE